MWIFFLDDRLRFARKCFHYLHLKKPARHRDEFARKIAVDELDDVEIFVELIDDLAYFYAENIQLFPLDQKEKEVQRTAK